MRSRSLLILILAFGVFAAPLASAAQGTTKIPRVGIISSLSPSDGRHFVDAFRSGLRELGYIEGQNIVIEERWAEGKPHRFGELIADLLRSKAGVILISSAAGARAAKNAATTTPVVFVGVSDPVGSGIVESLVRPGGNITGLSLAHGEGFAGKWVELVKDALPRVSDVAALAQTDHHMKGAWVTEMGAAAKALGVKLQVIADFARQQRLPTMGFVRDLVGEGVLMSYGPSITDSYRRAAVYVDRILKGAKPADLPVEQPTKFEFVLNRRTAKALNLTIPPSILIRADEVIE